MVRRDLHHDPYKIQLLQEIKEIVYEQRLNLAQRIQRLNLAQRIQELANQDENFIHHLKPVNVWPKMVVPLPCVIFH